MIIGRSEETRPIFGVWRMALALVLAAFLGAALGLAWQNFGAADEEAAQSGDVVEELTEEDEAAEARAEES
ncbi:hypothetical protein [Alteraurantiacibacter palmitatis]|uniref:Uncharacterized protein n=1 Tax=Alteraurantiacibacter palmitatis TaxID=2054628 RepID=A0ABV7EB82_9SPHN